MKTMVGELERVRSCIGHTYQHTTSLGEKRDMKKTRLDRNGQPGPLSTAYYPALRHLLSPAHETSHRFVDPPSEGQQKASFVRPSSLRYRP